MKNLLLINSKLLNQFWDEVIDIANYLQNRLPIKYIADKTIIISEKG